MTEHDDAAAAEWLATVSRERLPEAAYGVLFTLPPLDSQSAIDKVHGEVRKLAAKVGALGSTERIGVAFGHGHAGVMLPASVSELIATELAQALEVEPGRLTVRLLRLNVS